MVRMRTRSRCRAALALCAWLLIARGSAVAAEPLRPEAVPVDLVLRAHLLSGVTMRVMTREVTRIWASAGVAVTLRQNELQVPIDGRFVRLLFLESTRCPDQGVQPVVGQFRADERRILVSMCAATRAARRGLAQRHESPELLPIALGYVLGRIVAHELGHALLGAAHAADGLMRATFAPAVLTDPRSHHFGLHDDDTARLSAPMPAARVAVRTAHP